MRELVPVKGWICELFHSHPLNKCKILHIKNCHLYMNKWQKTVSLSFHNVKNTRYLSSYYNVYFSIYPMLVWTITNYMGYYRCFCVKPTKDIPPLNEGLAFFQGGYDNEIAKYIDMFFPLNHQLRLKLVKFLQIRNIQVLRRR